MATDLPPALVSLAASGFWTLGVTQTFLMTRHQLPVFTTSALLFHHLTHKERQCFCLWVHVSDQASESVREKPVCKSRSSLCDTSLSRCVFHIPGGGHRCPHTPTLPLCTAETTLYTHTRTVSQSDILTAADSETEPSVILCVCVCVLTVFAAGTRSADGARTWRTHAIMTHSFTCVIPTGEG